MLILCGPSLECRAYILPSSLDVSCLRLYIIFLLDVLLRILLKYLEDDRLNVDLREIVDCTFMFNARSHVFRIVAAWIIGREQTNIHT